MKDGISSFFYLRITLVLGLEAGKFDNDKKPTIELVKKNAITINAFLKFATHGHYIPHAVTEWTKRNLEESHEAPEVLWLDESEWISLSGAMDNQNIAAIASLAYWSGFRAEELPHLRRDSVVVDSNGDTRVTVGKIADDAGNVVWKPKTKDSYGSVHIPAMAKDALTTLQNANSGSFLLFPNVATNGGKPIRKDGFVKAKEFWTVDAFCEAFRNELRAAAVKLGWKKEKVNLIDSRTPRRSCGKRVLLASNLETAARVLRDSKETVKKHYARLLPDDVRITA